MAMQQINLYCSSLRKPKTRWSAQKLLVSLAGVAGVMLVLSLIYGLQAGRAKEQLEAVQAEQKQKMAQLENLQQQIQARKKDETLQMQVDALMLDISNRQKVMKVLGQQRFGNIDGFSEHISGLARQRIDGLWLTQIRISHGGETLGMKGGMLKAELLPRYLQRLSSEHIFTGKVFETLSMSRDEKRAGRMVFELQGVGEEISSQKMRRSYAANGDRR